MKQLFIDEESDIITALKQMDSVGKKLLIVQRNNKYFSLISIGDIQRAIINNLPLHAKINKIIRKQVVVAYENDNQNVIKDKMLNARVEFMPILDQDGNLKDIVFWESIFTDGQRRIKRNLNLPVVIMAGGEGKRLRPLTHVFPKALIPFNNKTIIEEIMDHFIQVGCSRFILSVNHKANLIRYYFESSCEKKYNIKYINEQKPLGTIGSLYLLKNKIKSTFFISNCDIVVEQELGAVYDYHKVNKNELTIVSALKHYDIPYGSIKTNKNGILQSLVEKPSITLQINTGLYIFEPHLLLEIPNNKFYHVTDLINAIKIRKGKIGVFPVSEKSWMDAGNWTEYFKFFK